MEAYTIAKILYFSVFISFTLEFFWIMISYVYHILPNAIFCIILIIWTLLNVFSYISYYKRYMHEGFKIWMKEGLESGEIKKVEEDK